MENHSKGVEADVTTLRVELFKHFYADQNQFGINHDNSAADLLESLITLLLPVDHFHQQVDTSIVCSCGLRQETPTPPARLFTVLNMHTILGKLTKQTRTLAAAYR